MKAMRDPLDATDARLSAWMVEDGQDRGSREALATALSRARATRQRRRWSMPLGWPPIGGLGGAVVPVPAMTLMVAGLLVLALLAALLLAASRPTVPKPFGPAGNGLIAYASGGRLYVAMPDGTGARRLVETPGSQWGPAFSPAGDRIAYWAKPPDGPHQLIVANADGSAPRDVVAGSGAAPMAAHVAPVWSPDGQALAVVVQATGSDARLVVARTDGGGVRELPVPHGQLSDVAWSPDGQLLAYRRITDPTVAIVIVGLDGSRERTLVSETIGPSEAGDPGQHAYGLRRTMQGFRWSPLSSRIAYTSGAGDVIVVDEDGMLHPVGADPAVAEFNPVWSPSGARLAYVTDDGDALMVADVDDPGRQRLAQAWTASPCLLFWSPDERSLLGSQDGARCPESSGRLVLLDLDSGHVRQLPDDVLADGQPSWQRVLP